MNQPDTLKTSYHRFHHRLAITNDEIPDFMGIKNAIYLSDEQTGNIIYFNNGFLKTKCSNGNTSLIPNLSIGDTIAIGSSNIISPGSVIIGEDSASKFVAGSDNIFLGKNVGKQILEGNNLIAIGQGSLADSSVIGDTIAIGAGSMGNCGKTEFNIGIGKDTLCYINDNYNIAIGIESMKEAVGPLINHNIAIGRESMKSIQPSAINIIALGSEVCANMTGTNFHSVYIGDKAGQNIQSGIISVNNVGIGSHVLKDANNIRDIICIGSSAGKNINGVRGILCGTNTAQCMSGSINEDILIGANAGSFRNYADAHAIFLGSQAGLTGSGKYPIGIGASAASDSNGDHVIALGVSAGCHSTGNENISIGYRAGKESSGSNNICIGSQVGKGVQGSRNILFGDSSQIGDHLNDSIAIGSNIFIKGTEAIVVGASAGKSSVGFLNRDILIGANAGCGQKYSDDMKESKSLLFIGANAGVGDPNNVDNINSSDAVCLGHSAGHSQEQSFHRTVMLGNYAGSFAEKVSNSVLLGHSAGVGMAGDGNIYIGANAGFNCRGEQNIFIGSSAGDQAGELNPHVDHTLLIGHKTVHTLLGDLQKGNLIIGATSLIHSWTDTRGSLAFVPTERPKNVNTVAGVLYSTNTHLEYTTPVRTSILTYPHKFVFTGELNGTTFILDTTIEGTSLLCLKIIPSDQLDYFGTFDLILHSKKDQLTLSPLHSSKWKVKIENFHFIIYSSINSIQGMLYLEVFGEHILRKV